MSRAQTTISFIEELADFFVSRPTPKQILDYRPSKAVQRRAEELLLKQNEGEISMDEKRELDQLASAEVLMRLIKAKLRPRNRGHA